MNNLIESINMSLKTGNWHAALITALILPDIAGKVEFPFEGGTAKRYSDWFDKYCKEYYTSQIGPNHEIITFLNGNDCYALRCSLLHEGITSIEHQRAKSILDDFRFVIPLPDIIMHCNKIDNKLQLQIDLFCKDILNGIDNWMRSLSKEKYEYFQKMLTF